MLLVFPVCLMPHMDWPNFSSVEAFVDFYSGLVILKAIHQLFQSKLFGYPALYSLPQLSFLFDWSWSPCLNWIAMCDWQPCLREMLCTMEVHQVEAPLRSFLLVALYRCSVMVWYHHCPESFIMYWSVEKSGNICYNAVSKWVTASNFTKQPTILPQTFTR